MYNYDKDIINYSITKWYYIINLCISKWTLHFYKWSAFWKCRPWHDFRLLQLCIKYINFGICIFSISCYNFFIPVFPIRSLKKNKKVLEEIFIWLILFIIKWKKKKNDGHNVAQWHQPFVTVLAAIQQSIRHKKLKCFETQLGNKNEIEPIQFRSTKCIFIEYWMTFIANGTKVNSQYLSWKL